MKNRYLLYICFFLINTSLSAQMLDKELETHKDEIISFLKKSGEIDVTTDTNSEKEFLISGKIAKIGEKAVFFKVGLSSSHSNQYLSILSNGKLFIFPTKNFESEFDSILNSIKAIKLCISAKRLTECLKNIKSIYDYNKSQKYQVPNVTN